MHFFPNFIRLACSLCWCRNCAPVLSGLGMWDAWQQGTVLFLPWKICKCRSAPVWAKIPWGPGKVGFHLVNLLWAGDTAAASGQTGCAGFYFLGLLWGRQVLGVKGCVWANGRWDGSVFVRYRLLQAREWEDGDITVSFAVSPPAVKAPGGIWSIPDRERGFGCVNWSQTSKVCLVWAWNLDLRYS